MRISLRIFEICGENFVHHSSSPTRIFSISHTNSHSLSQSTNRDLALLCMQIADFSTMFIVIWISLFKRWVAPEVHFSMIVVCILAPFISNKHTHTDFYSEFRGFVWRTFYCAAHCSTHSISPFSVSPFVYGFSECPIFNLHLHCFKNTLSTHTMPTFKFKHTINLSTAQLESHSLLT